MADYSIDNYDYNDDYDQESGKGSQTEQKKKTYKLDKTAKNVNIPSSRTKI